MLCQTIKQGRECFFMSTQGCTYNGGTCHPIVESCQNCNRTLSTPHGQYCQSCPDPRVKWRNGNCNLATHVERKSERVAKINPLKASKRSKRQ